MRAEEAAEKAAFQSANKAVIYINVHPSTRFIVVGDRFQSANKAVIYINQKDKESVAALGRIVSIRQ